MNQPQMPGDRSPMKSVQPVVNKRLWITLIIIAILGGFFVAWYLLLGPGKPVKVVTTTTTPVAIDATADWKTYANNTYGFSLKYPKDWVLKEENTNDNILVVQSDESLNPEDAVVLKYYSSISGLNHTWDGSNNAKTIDEFINNVGFKKLGTVNIGSIESLKFLEGALGGSNFDILTLKNGQIYMFQLIGKEQLTNIDAQILSTFQFTK